MRRVTVLSGLCVLSMVANTQATHITYSDFNVVIMSDLGSASSDYKGDIGGRAVALGSAYLKAFSLNEQGYSPHTPFSLYSGGDVKLSGSIYNGGIDAAGNVTIRGGSVAGSIVAGGSLRGNGGTIAGDVTLTGNNLAGNGLNIVGAVSEGMGYAPTLELQSVGQFFHDISTTVSNMADTLTPETSADQILINAVSGENVFTLPASNLLSGSRLTINAPADAVVYINLTGTNIVLDGLQVDYTGGISKGKVLMNMPQANSLEIRGNTSLSLLAPHADTNFASGILDGQLFVGSLTGKGSIHQSSFDGLLPVAAPEPASLLMVMILGTLLIQIRRSRVRTSHALH